jgi:hypothetical protein
MYARAHSYASYLADKAQRLTSDKNLRNHGHGQCLVMPALKFSGPCIVVAMITVGALSYRALRNWVSVRVCNNGQVLKDFSSAMAIV